MPISAATPAAARGSESAMLRRICSRDSWEGARVIPWPPERVDQLQQPASELGVGDLGDQLRGAEVDADVARLAPPEAVGVAIARQRGHDRVADRGQDRPLGVAQHVSASSPEPIDRDLVPGLAGWPVASRVRANRARAVARPANPAGAETSRNAVLRPVLRQDEVVPVDRLLGGVGEQLTHLL